MSRFIDLTGKEFGSLKVIHRAENIKSHTAWLCECECGNIKAIRGESLKSGRTVSCGCYNKNKNLTHGHAKTNNVSPEYRSWVQMISRCSNPNYPQYYYYGGRGIEVCDRWKKSFINFLKDMGEKPSNDYSLERLDVNKGYSPDNCIWANKTQQSRNRRVSVNNQTGHRGIGWYRQGNKYRVQIRANKKKIHIGYFDTLEEAIKAREQAEKTYWKDIKRPLSMAVN